MNKIKVSQKSQGKLYNTLFLFVFLVFLAIILLFTSCTSCSESGRRAEIASTYTTDKQFLNCLNNLDSTAIIADLYLEKPNGNNVYCIVITQGNTSFLYKGTNGFFKRYYSTHSLKEKAKDL